MYNIVSKLLIYGDMDEESILMQLSDIFRCMDEGSQTKDILRTRVFKQVKRILEVATDYAFDKNLWHNYLTYLLITNENPFSITCEKVGASEGSVNHFAKSDFKAFKELFDFDFSRIEDELGVDCFSRISDYKAIGKPELMYNKNVSEKVQALSEKLETAKDENEFFDMVTDFYKAYGVGMFGLNKAFRIEECGDNNIRFRAINNMDKVVLSDLVGYEIQKQKLVENTEAFVEGRKANNVLLFGDSGTGKSTSIKAIVNEYYDQGLRMIEIYKHQFKDLSNVIAQIKNRNYRFIIYMDDLSFEEFEIEYKYLKAVIEGGLERKPENILIYATSNRRHLVRERAGDKLEVGADDDIHSSDTVQEKLSLVYRFGVRIYFGAPDRKEFHMIVKTLAKRNGISMPEDQLLLEAGKWEISHGGLTGRTAQQFIDHLLGKEETQEA